MPRIGTLGLASAAAIALIAAFILQGQGNNPGFLAAIIAACWTGSAAALSLNRRAGAIVTALVAFAVSMYLGNHHVNVAAEAICNVNEVFNCDLVNRSPHSEVRGVPVAYLGAAFYLGAAVVALLGRPGSKGFQNAPQLLVLGGGLSVLYSVFLAWASTQVGAWCLFCVTLYGLNGLLLVAGLLWSRETGVALGDGLKAVFFAKDEKSLTVLGLILVVGVIGGRAANKSDAPETAGADGGGSGAGITVFIGPESVPLDGTEPVVGNPNAKITVVEFADFECPHCAVVAPDLHDLASASPDVKVLFKNYPLDNACNPNIKRLFHRESCAAAQAGECARQQGRFWELNRLMFINQEALDGDALSFMGAQIGLDKATYEACRVAPETVAAVQEDIKHATAIGIDGTPSIFVGGLYPDRWVQVRNPGDIGSLLKLAAAGQPLPTPVPKPADE